MFALRRAAAKAVLTQPARQLSTLNAFSRVSQFHPQTPTICRLFHQSRRWLSEEEQKMPVKTSSAQAVNSGEPVSTEPPEAELKDIKSESIASSETLDSAKESSERVAETVQEKTQRAVQDAKATVKNAAEQARQFASNAAQTAQDAVSGGAEAAAQKLPPRNSDATFGASREVRPSRILYIGNLFFEVTSSQLEAEFGKYGEVSNSRIVTDAKGLSRGFGYIEFVSQDEADKAVREADQKVFQGRRMAVQYHVRREPRRNDRPTPAQNPESRTLFIGNMSYQMSDKDLNDVFKEIRDVLDIRVAIDRRSGQPRGFAHADFIDVASAKRAKDILEKKVIYGRQLRVDYSTSTGPRYQNREDDGQSEPSAI